MKVVILLNGEPYRGAMDAEGAYVICCDGAYGWAKDRVEIDELIGDLDSFEGPLPDVTINSYPAEKDKTDGELALDRAIEKGATSILIYGGGGGREDHFLGNLHLLYKAHENVVRATLFTNHACIFISQWKCGLCYRQGTIVSIIPFGGDAHIIQGRGFKYPLEDLFLRYGSTRGISNIIADGEEASFISDSPVLVIVNLENNEIKSEVE